MNKDLDIKYYLALSLPLKVLLLYYQYFDDLEIAEDFILNKLPWFSIWEEEQVNQWEGKKIFIPLKDSKKGANTYRVTMTVDIESSKPFSKLEEKILDLFCSKNLPTKIISVKLDNRRMKIEPDEPVDKRTS